VASFLAASTKAHVSSLARDGAPHVVPISYVVLDGCITFWADDDSQKVVNLRRDPRVSAVVDDGNGFQELRGVLVHGTAELVRDEAMSGRVADLFSLRAPEEHRDGARSMLFELSKERTVVIIRPQRVASWDHRKLAGGARPQDLGR
jgi:PPOX class probable F420-dependent enzyme